MQELSSETPLKVIVGLGNPGSQYALNRHNVGYLLVDILQDRYAFPPFQRKGQAYISQGAIDQTPVFLLKPLTFMNLSGQAVGPFLHFHRIVPEDLLVVHDDLDLPFGKLRCKKNGGTGGHNGLRSLDQTIGSNYWRMRVGIGHPGEGAQVTGHVLGNFTQPEQEEVSAMFSLLVDYVPLIMKKNFHTVINAMGQALKARHLEPL